MKKRRRRIGCSLLIILLVLSMITGGFLYYSAAKVNIDDLQNISSQDYYVSSTDMQDYVKNAFIAVEDKRFKEHDGVDWEGTARALLVSLKNGEASQGGSTITQQLAKNYYFSNEKSISRKIKEIIVAKKIENNYSKDEIMSYYLNTIYFGSNIYNIEQAANTYFGVTTNKNNTALPQITILQSAILASTINAPSNYDVKNFATDTALQERTKSTLTKMFNQNYITEAQYNEAVQAIPASS